ELQTNVKAQIQVKPTFDLSAEVIGDYLNDSIEHATDDVKKRKLHEKSVDGLQLKQTVEKAFQSAAHLLTEEETDLIKSHICVLNEALNAKDSIQAINAAIKNLETAAEPLMQKRLQWVLDQTLTGKSIS